MASALLIVVAVVMSLVLLAVAIYLLILYIHRNLASTQLTIRVGELPGIAKS